MITPPDWPRGVGEMHPGVVRAGAWGLLGATVALGVGAACFGVSTGWADAFVASAFPTGLMWLCVLLRGARDGFPGRLRSRLFAGSLGACFVLLGAENLVSGRFHGIRTDSPWVASLAFAALGSVVLLGAWGPFRRRGRGSPSGPTGL